MSSSGPARLRMLTGAALAGSVITLSGCGDVDDQAVKDFVQQAEKAVQEAQDAAKEAQEEAAERAAATEEAMNWPARPPLPPQEAEWRYASNHGDWAAEDAIYPASAYDDVVDHYADHYGEPPKEYQGFVEWSSGGGPGVKATWTRVTKAGDQVGVTSTWPAP